MASVVVHAVLGIEVPESVLEHTEQSAADCAAEALGSDFHEILAEGLCNHLEGSDYEGCTIGGVSLSFDEQPTEEELRRRERNEIALQVEARAEGGEILMPITRSRCLRAVAEWIRTGKWNEHVPAAKPEWELRQEGARIILDRITTIIEALTNLGDFAGARALTTLAADLLALARRIGLGG